MVQAGDCIIGDLNGVVCLSKALAEKALDLIPSQVEADGKIAKDIQQGSKFAAASEKHRSGVKHP